eukprot:4408595-Alexandrium_andersonii.AAC.1
MKSSSSADASSEKSTHDKVDKAMRGASSTPRTVPSAPWRTRPGVHPGAVRAAQILCAWVIQIPQQPPPAARVMPSCIPEDPCTASGPLAGTACCCA